jgi:hypothetical protein
VRTGASSLDDSSGRELLNTEKRMFNSGSETEGIVEISCDTIAVVSFSSSSPPPNHVLFNIGAALCGSFHICTATLCIIITLIYLLVLFTINLPQFHVDSCFLSNSSGRYDRSHSEGVADFQTCIHEMLVLISFVSGLIRSHHVCRNVRFDYSVRRCLLFTLHRLVLRSYLSGNLELISTFHLSTANRVGKMVDLFVGSNVYSISAIFLDPFFGLNHCYSSSSSWRGLM